MFTFHNNVTVGRKDVKCLHCPYVSPHIWFQYIRVPATNTVLSVRCVKKRIKMVAGLWLKHCPFLCSTHVQCTYKAGGPLFTSLWLPCWLFNHTPWTINGWHWTKNMQSKAIIFHTGIPTTRSWIRWCPFCLHYFLTSIVSIGKQQHMCLLYGQIVY